VIYRKRGTVIRYENGFIVRSTEAGEAIDDGTFRCAPIDAEPLALANSEVADIARRIEAIADVERLIVSEGIAEHECDGIRWTEQTKRVHVAFKRGAMRAIVDLADFELDDVQRAADVLARASDERERPERVRLAPNIGAALLPSLIGTIELWQSAAEHDGKGLPVIEQKLTNPPWPNWWRPSYRTRPVRMPLHIRALDGGEMHDAPRAVALLAPVAGNVLHVLLEDGVATTIAVEQVLAVRNTNRWYPYAAGSFGAELLV
jgi:hypothetical protein